MSLDALYGDGTMASLTAALEAVRPDPVVSECDNPDGSVHVEVEWGEEKLRTDFRGETIRITYLSTMCHGDPSRRELGWETSKALNVHLPPWLKSIGVTAIEARPLDDASSEAIRTTGGYSDRGGQLLWEL